MNPSAPLINVVYEFSNIRWLPELHTPVAQGRRTIILVWYCWHQNHCIMRSSAVKLFIRLCQVQKHEKCYNCKIQIWDTKKRSIDKYFQWQIHNTVLKHNAPAQDEETARRHEGGLWHYSVTHCTHTAGIQRPVEALTVQLPVVSGWTPTYYVKYINSFGCSASVRLEECKNVGFATPVLDLCMCHCST